MSQTGAWYLWLAGVDGKSEEAVSIASVRSSRSTRLNRLAGKYSSMIEVGGHAANYVSASLTRFD
jgi:hypothetical protein